MLHHRFVRPERLAQRFLLRPAVGLLIDVGGWFYCVGRQNLPGVFALHRAQRQYKRRAHHADGFPFERLPQLFRIGRAAQRSGQSGRIFAQFKVLTGQSLV